MKVWLERKSSEERELQSQRTTTQRNLTRRKREQPIASKKKSPVLGRQRCAGVSGFQNRLARRGTTRSIRAQVTRRRRKRRSVEEEVGIKSTTRAPRILSGGPIAGWSLLDWDWPKTIRRVSNAARKDLLLPFRRCNGAYAGERSPDCGWFRFGGWRRRSPPHSGRYKRKSQPPAQAKQADSVQLEGSCFLGHKACPCRVCRRLHRPSFCRGRAPQSCSAGPLDRVTGYGDVANSEVSRSGDTSREKESRGLFQVSEASDPPLLRRAMALLGVWRGCIAPGGVHVVSPRRFQRRVDHPACQKPSEERKRHGASRTKRRDERVSSHGKRYRRVWGEHGRAEVGGPSEEERPTCFLCRSTGASLFKRGRWPWKGSRGWDWWPCSPIFTTSRRSSQSAGGREEGDRNSERDGPGGGEEEEKEEGQLGEHAGKGCPDADPSGSSTREEEEPQPIPQQEEEEEEKETELRLKRQQSVKSAFELHRLQLGSPFEAALPEVSRLSVQNARAAGSGAAGCGRRGGGGLRSGRLKGTETEASHVLSNTVEAGTGPEEPRQQGTGPPQPHAGPPTGGTASGSGGCAGCPVDSRAHCHEARVGHSKAFRSLWRGRRCLSSTARDPVSPETRKAAGQGRGQRILEQGPKLGQRRLVLRAKAQGKSKRRKGKDKERKGERQIPKRRMDFLGSTKRKWPGEGQEGRGRNIKPRLLGAKATLGETLCTQSPCVSPDTSMPCDSISSVESLAVEPNLAKNSIQGGREGPSEALATAGLPTCRTEWLTGLTACKNLAELGIRLAWGLQAGFAFVQNRARPTRAASGSRGSLFPLPVSVPEALPWNLADLTSAELSVTVVRCWVAVGCAATNRLYGAPCASTTHRAGKIHAAVLQDMEMKVRRFIEGEQVLDFGFSEAVQDLKDKKVSYTGEEISQPHPLTREQILKGLPPKGHGGSIPILPFLKGRTKLLLENPLESILAESDRGCVPNKAKVHIKKGSELEVFKLMEDRGVIKWFPDEEVFADRRGQYLSGLFGVVKPGKYTQSHLPVLRCIMNLIPINGLFHVLRGDIQSLPSATSWIPLHLGDGDVVTMSQGDMHAAFYLFEMPACWSPFMCFNWRVQGRDLGFHGDQEFKWFRPCCRVLPMEWASSVGIMQAVSREILLSKGLSPELELRRGTPLPAWFTQVANSSTPSRAWWQVYLDNFMAGEVEDGGNSGKDATLQEVAMRAWSNTGVLSAEDKQVLSRSNVTELGVRFDGQRGLLGSSPERLMRTIFVTLHHILNPVWSKREAQMVLGRWIFILQFRRAGMCTLARSWEVLEKRWPTVKDLEILHTELLTLVFLGPLLQTDLTASYDGEVTVSDASETGGASAVSKGLTWSGRSLVNSKADLRLQPIKVPLLIISLFNGIGGAFRLYDILCLLPEGRISVDISRHGNRVTRTTWPGVLELHDVEQLTREDVYQWASWFPHIEEVHFYAGFPCVHLSSARAFRRNLDGEGSSLFWKMLEILAWVQDIFFSVLQSKVLCGKRGIYGWRCTHGYFWWIGSCAN